MDQETYKTGAVIPVSGMYRIVHNAHLLPGAAILLEQETFPSCAKCHGAITFELLNSDPSEFSYEPLRLQEIPLMPYDTVRDS
jgi:hypothetical protein